MFWHTPDCSQKDEFFAVMRIVTRRVGVFALGLLACAPVGPALAQSLFSSDGQATPLFDAGAAPLLAPSRSGLVEARAAPMVEARALALGDAEGLAARRSARREARQPRLAPWTGYQPPSRADILREVAALWNNPPKDFSNETDLICIAVSIYHEARNQPRDGQAAVATVILNRAANPDRWGWTPCQVVAPVQFSYLRPDRSFARIRNRRSWNEAVEIAAEKLLSGPDPALYGADHYHATYVDPPWNRSMDWVVRIDDHIFWRSRPSTS